MNSAPAPSAEASDATAPFAGLTPDAVLNAIDSAGRDAGLATTGTLLTLNSYENRVYQAGVEDADGRTGFVIAKFYRPGRWSDAQIEEEHAFVAELAAAEVPVTVTVLGAANAVRAGRMVKAPRPKVPASNRSSVAS